MIPKNLMGQVRKIKFAWQDEDGDWCVVTKLQPDRIMCYALDGGVATLIGRDDREESFTMLKKLIIAARPPVEKVPQKPPYEKGKFDA